MLTLERKVSQVEELVKQIDPELEYQQKELKHSSPKRKSSGNLKELFLNGSFLTKLLAEKLENNWEGQINEKKLNQLKELLQVTNNAIEVFKKPEILLINTKGFKKQEINPDFKKELKKFNDSLEYLSQVLSDTIEFVNIASEITELRSKPVTQDESERIQQILVKSEEIAGKNRKLPKEEVKKSMKSILEAMRKT
ncbi:hypothetical protein [Nostoc sp.]|uniref:hypothetical protein n=1 Tax=Nostoc sp. TaxID=1180 RepID=UPI002FF76F75